MVDLNVAVAKLSALDGYLGRVKRFEKKSTLALEQDEDVKDIVAFNLMLAVQTATDLAAHIVSDERGCGFGALRRGNLPLVDT